MDTVPYTVRNYGETAHVAAVQPTPGLYVYQLPEHLRHPHFPWMVGHASGHAIAAFEKQPHALAAARLLADFTDWQRTADELRADVDTYALADLIEGKTTGVLISADPARRTQAA